MFFFYFGMDRVHRSTRVQADPRGIVIRCDVLGQEKGAEEGSESNATPRWLMMTADSYGSSCLGCLPPRPVRVVLLVEVLHMSAFAPSLLVLPVEIAGHKHGIFGLFLHTFSFSQVSALWPHTNANIWLSILSDPDPLQYGFWHVGSMIYGVYMPLSSTGRTLAQYWD